MDSPAVSPSAAEPSSERFLIPAESFFLLACIAAGGLLRLHQLGEESMWLDESFTRMWITKDTWPQTFSIFETGDHPPIYFALLRAWCRFASANIAWMRLFSVVVSILTIPIFFFFSRRILGQPAAIFATLLLAASPYHVYYAQEARAYAWLVFCATCLLWAASEAQSALGNAKAVRWRFRFVASVAIIGLIYSHYSSLFVVIALFVEWTFFMIVHRGTRAVVREGICWIGFALLAAAPCFWIVSHRVESGDGVSWLPPITASTFVGIANAFTYGISIVPPPWYLKVAIPFALIVAALGLWRVYGSKSLAPRVVSGRWWLGVLIGVLFVLPILVSLKRPVIFFGQRYMFTATLPWLLLLGAGLGALWRGRFKPIAIVLLLVMLAASTLYYRPYFSGRQKRQYDRAAVYLEGRLGEGDIIVMVPDYSDLALNYYLRQPFRIAEHEAGAIESTLEESNRPAVWFVDISVAPTTLEREIAEGAARIGHYVFADPTMPGLTLRVTGYRIDGP